MIFEVVPTEEYIDIGKRKPRNGNFSDMFL